MLSFVWNLTLFSFFFFSYTLHYLPDTNLMHLTLAQGLGMLLSIFISSGLPTEDSPMYYIYSLIYVVLAFATMLIPGSFAPVTIFLMRLYLSLLLPLTDQKTSQVLTPKLY